MPEVLHLYREELAMTGSELKAVFSAEVKLFQAKGMPAEPFQLRIVRLLGVCAVTVEVLLLPFTTGQVPPVRLQEALQSARLAIPVKTALEPEPEVVRP